MAVDPEFCVVNRWVRCMAIGALASQDTHRVPIESGNVTFSNRAIGTWFSSTYLAKSESTTAAATRRGIHVSQHTHSAQRHQQHTRLVSVCVHYVLTYSAAMFFGSGKSRFANELLPRNLHASQQQDNDQHSTCTTDSPSGSPSICTPTTAQRNHIQILHSVWDRNAVECFIPNH